MTEILAHGYSSQSTQQELSDEYEYDRVKMIFKILCFFVHWTKVTPAAKDTCSTDQLGNISKHFVEISLKNVIYYDVHFSPKIPN